MKKRGVKPNAQAYTMMLRGLSKSDKVPNYDPLKLAWSIYQNLFRAELKPMLSLIHHNAMLNVCANHLGMDTMWEIAGQLPEEGKDSPDSFTYTIILNAIRKSIQWETGKLQDDQLQKVNDIRIKGVTEAKRVWSDVVGRWERGSLKIENMLVSSMAGVLFEGTGDGHLYEVLQLFNQTTGVPVFAKKPPPVNMKTSRRLNSRMGTPITEEQARKESNVPFVDAKGKKFMAADAESAFYPGPESFTGSDYEYQREMTEDEEKELQETLWRRVVPEGTSPNPPPLADGPSYLPIGNRDLTLIMETCLQMTESVGPAKSYWRYLVEEKNEHSVVPDRRSFVRYLRVLRVARQSRLTAEVIRDQMVPQGLESGLPFHLGLSTCRRDRKNLNVFTNANQMLQLMDSALLFPDCRALESYLELIKVLRRSPQDLLVLNGLDPKKQSSETKLADRGSALRLDLDHVAVQNLRPHVAKLHDGLKASTERTSSLLGTHGVPSALVRTQAQTGALAMKILTEVRALVDSILKHENVKLLNKSDRAHLQHEAIDLRTYSDAEVIKKLRNKTVFPTVKQQELFYENVIAPREKVQTEKSLPLAEEETEETKEDLDDVFV